MFESLEWLLCVSESDQPSALLEDLKSPNPQYRFTTSKILKNDFSIVEFLPESVAKSLINCGDLQTSFHKIYFPASAASFLKEAGKLLKPILKSSTYQNLFYGKLDNLIFHYNSQYLFPDEKWEPHEDEDDDHISNPASMLKYLKSFRRYDSNFRKIELGNLDLIMQMISVNFIYVHYLPEFLSLLTDKNICKILQNDIAPCNLYSILRFVRTWKPISSSAITCRQIFIRTLTPLVQQVIFAPQPCWYDSKTDPCERCLIEKWDIFLPQLRCTALCGINQSQCHRFSKVFNGFCLHHELQNPKKYLKRHYQKPNKSKDATELQYSRNPYLKHVDQPARYFLTHRPITPITSLVSRTTENTTFRFTDNKKEQSVQYKKGYYLPVVRYEDIYYSKSNESSSDQTQKFCGKFFYFEPESDVYLFLGKSCFFATKLDAFLQLTALKYVLKVDKEDAYDSFDLRYELDNSDFPLFLSNYPNYKVMMESLFHSKFIGYNVNQYLLNKNKDMKKKEYAEFWDKFLTYRFRKLFVSFEDFDPKWHELCIPVFYPTAKNLYQLPSITEYGPDANGVAEQDDYDQIICKMAKELGFDTIVLQHEMGNNDSVTEIIHTGNFKENLNEINGLTISTEQQALYPKIWFPKENGLLYIDEKQDKTYTSVSTIDKLKDIFKNKFTAYDVFEKQKDEEELFTYDPGLPQKKFQSHKMEYNYPSSESVSDSESVSGSGEHSDSERETES